jgi:hypothetical protein
VQLAGLPALGGTTTLTRTDLVVQPSDVRLRGLALDRRPIGWNRAV